MEKFYWRGKRRDRLLKQELTHKAIKYTAFTVLPLVKLVNQQAKKMRLGSRIKEGYKALNSVEEVCISRVAAILTLKFSKGNVAYCRIVFLLQELTKR